jgi:hypothetical protein
MLIAAGANINARDAQGSTALLYAAAGGHLECVEALLAAHADPNIRNDDGKSALDWAVILKYTAVADALRRAGAR